MDLSEITDITQLKAFCYDEITKRDTAQRNIDLIQARIMQVASMSAFAAKSQERAREIGNASSLEDLQQPTSQAKTTQVGEEPGPN